MENAKYIASPEWQVVDQKQINIEGEFLVMRGRARRLWGSFRKSVKASSGFLLEDPLSFIILNQNTPQ